ncbi:carboxypeptidase-like regulatory domain-containing protein [Bacteroides sp. 519]|uniref:carboxypeptidase-like regulatory domain-containing protein n=1 Tax=Bacteroides sp. 519 TaxID=2302937 RepID=UPI0013D3F051|nr:carboxypeptidase-like regulatory domain-containing protein [Bacteroides sp. 519]NDV58000.1 carboxypeptidase-like regulatory domain-containing protein [Bacteroides sp. 519]
MRTKLLFISCIISSLVSAQENQRLITGQIIDCITKELLPYATIYTTKTHGAISNQEGFFSIEVGSENSNITISYVGYEKKIYSINEIPTIIELQPLTVNLSDVIITPIDCANIVNKLFEKYSQVVQTKNQTPKRFFYRQTTKTDNTCNEILEAFFSATSLLCIRELELVEGRYAELLPDSLNQCQYMTFTNYIQYSQFTLIDPKKDKKDKLIVPLRADFSDFYDLSIDALGHKDIYEIKFLSKKNINRPIVEGSLFIDPEQLTILKFEGKTRNAPPTGRGGKLIKNHKLNFSIIYKQIDELPIVESVNVHNSFVCIDFGVSNSVEINSILYNLNLDTKEKGKKIYHKTNLIELIAKRKYSPDFWTNNEIIKRTPLEDSAISIFEKENKFGTYSNE